MGNPNYYKGFWLVDAFKRADGYEYQPRQVARKVNDVFEEFNFETGLIFHTFDGTLKEPIPYTSLPPEGQAFYEEIRDHFFPELGRDKPKFTPS